MPAVAMLGMNPCVTRFAQGDEIVFIMRSTLGEWALMVYLLGCNVASVLQALLTQWVGRSIAVADAFPSSAVALLGSRVTVVAFIPLGLQLGVLLTEAPVCQVGAAGIGTWSLWFSWQYSHLLLGIRKALRDFSHKALFDFRFLLL